jgi:hypothetical protein
MKLTAARTVGSVIASTSEERRVTTSSGGTITR